MQGILTRRQEKSKGHPHELHRLQVEELASKFQVNFSAIQGLFVAARLTAQPESRLSATPRTLSANTLTNFFAVGNCLNCDFHHCRELLQRPPSVEQTPLPDLKAKSADS